MTAILNPKTIRAQFPALKSKDVYFDNPGGTQVVRNSLDRLNAYLVENNANSRGAFKTSQESDAMIDSSRLAMAEFLNASSASEIVFGPNMTSLTMNLSRSIAQQLSPDDELIVTNLDHDANISPWLLIAEERGCKVYWLDFDVEDCTLQVAQLESLLSERTRLVAVGYASNAVGTINPVRRIARMAHEAGAWCFVDAVQFAPHGPIDVQEIDCDFMAISAYKFFGPHIGVLFGKLEHLEALPAYKIRPASDAAPNRFETGTQNHEGIAGTLGALEYLEQLGIEHSDEDGERFAGKYTGRALHLKNAMTAIRNHEMGLSEKLIEALTDIPGLRIYGLTEKRGLDHRVPTVAFRIEGFAPRAIAQHLGRAGIYAWDGNYYALAVTERLGVEEDGGMVRVGLAHYNTLDEIERLQASLKKLTN